jgi:hypothetical protein
MAPRLGGSEKPRWSVLKNYVVLIGEMLHFFIKIDHQKDKLI